jgi:hypothetical protein
MVKVVGERGTYLSIELNTGIFQLCHQLPRQLIYDVRFYSAEITYIRSSISQVLIEAELDHLHLTGYFRRIQSYTSVSVFHLAHSSLTR